MVERERAFGPVDGRGRRLDVHPELVRRPQPVERKHPTHLGEQRGKPTVTPVRPQSLEKLFA